ncbi:MAG TPA: SEC-C metal-binding domain-containing protein [Planctomycetaceae bacterium]|nr:SEC-C metal-binding domain-containing protein [Planctomycetaceae bacterium]
MWLVPEERIVAALSSDVTELQDFALRSLSQTHSQHPKVLPAVLNLIERQGLHDPTQSRPIHDLCHCAWSAVTVERLLTLLERSPPETPSDDWMRVDPWTQWARVIERLPLLVTLPYRERILALPETRNAPFAAIRFAGNWAMRAPAEIAAELERICRDCATGVTEPEDFPADAAEALAGLLCGFPEFSGSWALSRLDVPATVDGDSMESWLDPYAVQVACQLRLANAVPLLVAKALDPNTGDYTLESLDEGLIHFGSDDVVERLSAAFSPELDCSPLLTSIRTVALSPGERAVQIALAWLPQLPQDDEPAAWLAGYLALRCSPQANEQIVEFIAGHPDTVSHTEWESVFDDLHWSAKLTGQEFPQLEGWREESHRLGEARRLEHERNWQRMQMKEIERKHRRAVDEWEQDDYEPRIEPIVAAPRVGRNDPCPCGSGKKFKKCCLKNTVSS